MSRSASRIPPVLAFVLALVVVATGRAVGQSEGNLSSRIDSKQKELEKIQKQIEEHRAQAKKLNREEAAVLKRLSSLDKEIDLSRSLVKNFAQQEALLTERIDSLRVEIARDEITLAEKRATLSRRLRQMYKRDPTNRWDLIMGSDNVHQLIRRYKFSGLVAEQDANLIEEVRAQKHMHEVETAQLTESLADVTVVRNKREEEATRLQQSKRQRQQMLGDIRGKKTQHASAIKELEKAQEDVKDLIGSLEEKRLELERQGVIADGEFAKLQGKLIRPVEGKILRGFGRITHPKYGTVTFNNGVDIEAPSGTPIRAVAPGVVEFVDWIDAYGKCIILNHGGGYYTLYAHVANTFVTQGRRVEHGEVIAEVGNTGSLEGFECHFEIRQSKKALDPTKWFAK